jgi:predicted DCC family thiol-disulfide oxidoreductase YuxK
MSLPPSRQEASEEQHPIVVFDGVCNFCNASVSFILAHDRAGAFRFAALQSKTGRRLLERAALEPLDSDTFALIEGPCCVVRSDAVLAVARRLPAPWKWGVALAVVPRPWRDALYRLIARHRYRWFGRRDVCMRPTPDVRERFLE